jgi:hypothetical protein
VLNFREPVKNSFLESLLSLFTKNSVDQPVFRRCVHEFPYDHIGRRRAQAPGKSPYMEGAEGISTEKRTYLKRLFFKADSISVVTDRRQEAKKKASSREVIFG